MSREAKFRDIHYTKVVRECNGKSGIHSVRTNARTKPDRRLVSCQTTTYAVKQKRVRPLQKSSSFRVPKKQKSGPVVKQFVNELEPDVNDEEGMELLNVSLVIACLQIYAKDHGLDILEVLTSKVGEEVITEKSRIEDMKHSLQQTERENKSLHKDLMRIALIQENNKKETIDMRKEIEKYRLNSCTGNKIQHFEKEFEKRKLELYRNVREDALRQRAIVKSFKDELASQKQTLMQMERELEDRNLKLKHLEENSKSCKNLEEQEIFELRCQLREAFEIVQESRAKLVRAKHDTELEQRMRAEFEKKAIEYQNRNEVLQRANDELLMSQTVLQKTLKKLQKMEAELDETRSKNVFLKSDRETFRREVNEYKRQIICLEKANDELKSLQNQTKEHYESEVEQRVQLFETKDKLHETERKKLRKEIKETKDKLTELTIQHQHTIAKLKESEDKLDQTYSQKDVERRKRQELERKKSEYENRMKLSKDENVEELRSKEQRINQLEREVECKNLEIRACEVSCDKMNKDRSYINKLKEELNYNQGQLSELGNRMQHILTNWKKTEDELAVVKCEKENELFKRNELERKASEYQNRIEQFETEKTENVASQNQIVQYLKNELEASTESLNHEVNEKHQLRKDLKETENKVLELERQHQQALEKLETYEAELVQTLSEKESDRRIRKGLEKKPNENENRMKQTKNENDEIFKSQRQRIIKLEFVVQDKDREIKAFEDSLNNMKNDSCDVSKLIKELKESECKLSKAENQLQKVLAKLKKAEVNLQETNSEKEHILLISNENEEKANEYQNCIKHLEKENVEILTSHKQIIRDLEDEVKRKDNQLKDLQNSLDKTKISDSDRDRIREELHKTNDQLSEFRYKHHQTVAKLSEKEAQLDEARHGCQSEQQTREELEKKISNLENELDDTKTKNKQTIAFQKENIDALVKEAEDKDRKINNLETSIETLNREVSEGSQLKKDFKETEYKLSELEYRHQQTLEKLGNMEAELDKTLSDKDSERRNRKELERKARENENRIEQTRSENDEMLQSQKQIINELKLEVEDKDREIIALQASVNDMKHDKSEIIILKKKLKEYEDNLSLITNELQQTLTKLTKTENDLVESNSKRERALHKLSESEKKANKYQNCNQYLEKESTENMKSHKQIIQNLENEIERKDKQLQKLHESTKHYVSDKDKIEREYMAHISELRSKQHQTAIELKEQEVKLDDARREIHIEQQTRKDLERKLFESENRLKEANKQEIASQKEKIHYLENVVANKDNKMKELAASIEKNKLEINERQRLKMEVKKTKEKLSEVEIQHQQTLAKLSKREIELDEIKAKRGLQENDDVLKEMKDQLQQVLSKLKETETELDETKTRLSKAMGDRLTDNNPNIADLSDTNRPIKLAERFAELYDNQWTDAFDILETKYDREQQTIEALLQVLQDAMHFCEAKAKQQLDDVQNILGFSRAMETGKVPTDVRKHLKDCRKKMSSTAIRSLYEMYIAHIKISAPQKVKTAHDVQLFVKECLELCWLMTIQDPPVVLAPVAKRGSDLNTDVFKPYTSSGTHIEYTVWPALLLHNGGPVLAKGVAQGYGKKSKTKH